MRPASNIRNPKIAALGVGTLAVIAVFALLFLFSGDDATASNSLPPNFDAKAAEQGGGNPPGGNPPGGNPPDGNPTETPTPEPTPTPTPKVYATPVACPDAPAEVVATGKYALLDAWWNSDEDSVAGVTLTGNDCPASITQTRNVDPDDQSITWSITRGDPTFKIGADETVIHIPDHHRENLPATITRSLPEATNRATDDADKYPFAYDAGVTNATETKKTFTRIGYVENTDGTVKEEGKYESIWMLPYCDPTYTGDSGHGNDDDGVDGDEHLCLIFSAALLNAEDWRNAPVDSDGNRVVEQLSDIWYEFSSAREDLIAPDRGHVLVFYPYDDLDSDGDGEDDRTQVTWDTDVTDSNQLYVTPGTYEYRQWAFTEAGRYRLQIQAKGHPSAALMKDQGIRNHTLSTVAKTYVFHAGLMADLSAALTAAEAQPTPDGTADLGDLEPGDTVAITVTATNDGPTEATHVEVDVTLPAGLTYVSDNAGSGDRTDSYASATGKWTIGEMAEPTTTTTGGVTTTTPTTATLAIKATVDAGTRGQKLTTSATISAKQDVGSSQIAELDQNSSNDTGTVTVTPVIKANVNPIFHLERAVAENSAAGTKVGAPIAVRDPDNTTFTFGLTGTDANYFDVENAAGGGAQIVVGQGAILNYEAKSYYDLQLTISDGLNTVGDTDASVDDAIDLRINITDVAGETLTVNLAASAATVAVNGAVLFTTSFTTSPVAESQLTYHAFKTCDGRGANCTTRDGATDIGVGKTMSVSETTAGVRQYTMIVTYTDSSSQTVTVNSNTVSVTWTE